MSRTAPDVDEPVDGRRRRKPVDTTSSTTPSPADRARELFPDAQRRAAAKERHGAKPGTPELGARWSYGYYSRPPKSTTECTGQLRSAYARITVPGEKNPRTWSNPGRQKWVPIGVWCDGCAAFWPKPIDPPA